MDLVAKEGPVLNRRDEGLVLSQKELVYASIGRWVDHQLHDLFPLFKRLA